jgi:VanZ family protein
VLRWFAPGLSDEAVARAQYVGRKVGHLTEYAILAMLIWRALRGAGSEDAASWSWKRAGLAFGLAVLYAITDEWHQGYVGSRFGSGWDVLIDAAGAGAGLAVRWWIGRVRTRR